MNEINADRSANGNHKFPFVSRAEDVYALTLVDFLKLVQRAAFDIYFDTARQDENLLEKGMDMQVWLDLLGKKMEDLREVR